MGIFRKQKEKIEYKVVRTKKLDDYKITVYYISKARTEIEGGFTKKSLKEIDKAIEHESGFLKLKTKDGWEAHINKNNVELLTAEQNIDKETMYFDDKDKAIEFEKQSKKDGWETVLSEHKTV